MPTLYSLTLTQALANLRTDLSDTVQPYRWQDSDLTRALDKANERYSQANPWMQAIQIPTVTQCILYPFPAGAFYIDKVEYPVGQATTGTPSATPTTPRWPKQYVSFLERKSPLISAPSFTAQPNQGPPQITFSSGGSLGAGLYKYAATYISPAPAGNPGGETPASPTFQATSPGGSQQATLTNLPIGPYGVTGRNIYRTTAGGSSLLFAGSIADNVTGTYADQLADGSLGAAVPVVNTTANFDLVELQLPPELWPADTTGIIELTYAAKNELDSSGTTIPERHWDVLYLGAVAYAMWAYLPQVNDNFEYADGHLRDRVDDTKSAIAWQTQCLQARSDFEKALKVIREEANTAITLGTLHWGDKPLRWERL
jgi:hypothetical protein